MFTLPTWVKDLVWICGIIGTTVTGTYLWLKRDMKQSIVKPITDKLESDLATAKRERDNIGSKVNGLEIEYGRLEVMIDALDSENTANKVHREQTVEKIAELNGKFAGLDRRMADNHKEVMKVFNDLRVDQARYNERVDLALRKKSTESD